jgi:hypothetical protein
MQVSWLVQGSVDWFVGCKMKGWLTEDIEKEENE